jgi:hypothetical protein
VKQRTPASHLSEQALRAELGFTRAQWQSLRAAAEDASLPLRDYCRLMLLCAAGHGGVLEHAERVIDAGGTYSPALGPEGVCRRCGCTDDRACDGGCGWADAHHTLCTACVGACPGDAP